MLHVEDLIGGLWIPGDGVGDPYQICLTLMQEAQQRGVTIKKKKNIQKNLSTTLKLNIFFVLLFVIQVSEYLRIARLPKLLITVAK